MTRSLSPGRSLVLGLLLSHLALATQQPFNWNTRLSDGIAALKAGHAAEAIQLLVPLVDESRALPAEDVRRVEGSLALGAAYQYHGQLDKAEPLYVEAIAWLNASGENNGALLAVVFDNFGRLRLEQGRWSDAEEFLGKAREFYAQTRGSQDPRIANVDRLIGETYLSQGRIAEGTALLERAAQTLRRSPETFPPTLAAALRSLATAYSVQGRYAEADALLVESLQMNQDPGQTDLDRADTLLALGHVYLLQRDTARAMPLLQKAVRTFEVHDDSHLASALSEVGAAALQDGKFAIAREYLGRALDIDQKRFDWDHVAVALVQGALAEAYLGEHNYGQAASLIQQALANNRKSVGESHFTVAKLLMIEATIEARQRRASDADAHYRQALDIFRKTFAANHPDLVKAQREYAEFAKGARK